MGFGFNKKSCEHNFRLLANRHFTKLLLFLVKFYRKCFTHAAAAVTATIFYFVRMLQNISVLGFTIISGLGLTRVQ